MAVIKELYIDNFRAFKDISITIGDKLTAIAGQNATGKSTILGMLGQPFSFVGEETIFGKSYQTKFREIFKFSLDTEQAGTHKYYIKFKNRSICEETNVLIRSRARKDEGIRLVTRDEDRRAGKGNITFPVIYLGLKRGIPLGEIRLIRPIKTDLSSTEQEYIAKNHNQILILNEKIEVSYLKATKEKDTICVNTPTYKAITNSAGQDNLGQIIGAMISFQRLKRKMGNKYKGGLLLIDEIETAMYPGSQIRLIKYLIKSARDLNLQIVFTTHSIELLDFLLQPTYQHDNAISVVYLAKSRGKLQSIKDVNIQRIRNDLLMAIQERVEFTKLNLYCEDAEAAMLLKKLLSADHKKRLNVIAAKFSAGMLLELARSRVDEFKCSMFVLDADMARKIRGKRPDNLLLLPGNNSPEKMFLTFLEELSEDDTFWAEAGMGYTKQHFWDNHPHSNDREILKQWFKDERRYWGKREMSDLYKRWAQDNEPIIKNFRNSFTLSFNAIAKRKGMEYLN